MTIDKRKSPSGGRAAKRRPAEGDSCRRADAGFTFVEVVVTIVLMGLVVVPILAAVRGSIRASSLSESAAEVETLLINAVDRVNRAPRTPSFKCDLSEPVISAVRTHGWDESRPDVANIADVVQVSQQHLVSGTWVDGACPDTGFPPNGLVQRVTITITSPINEVTRTIEVVKSDV